MMNTTCAFDFWYKYNWFRQGANNVYFSNNTVYNIASPTIPSIAHVLAASVSPPTSPSPPIATW